MTMAAAAAAAVAAQQQQQQLGVSAGTRNDGPPHRSYGTGVGLGLIHSPAVLFCYVISWLFVFVSLSLSVSLSHSLSLPLTLAYVQIKTRYPLIGASVLGGIIGHPNRTATSRRIYRGPGTTRTGGGEGWLACRQVGRLTGLISSSFFLHITYPMATTTRTGR